MIRYIRIAVITLFAISVLAFGGSTIYSRLSKDTTGPVITVNDDNITISVADSTDALFENITAVDDADGDVHDLLTVESIGNFSSDMTREATIAAFDTKGNVTKQTITFRYSDYTSPRVELTAPLTVQATNLSSVLDSIKVTDCIDGDITGNLQITCDTDISQSVAGEYQVHLTASNSAGDTIDYPVTLDTYTYGSNTGLPEIALTDYLIYVKNGSAFDPEDYLDTLTMYNDVYSWNARRERFDYDEELSGQTASTSYSEDDEPESIDVEDFVIDNPVNTRTAGVYEVTYSFSEFDGGNTGTVRLIVVVED